MKTEVAGITRANEGIQGRQRRKITMEGVSRWTSMHCVA